MSGQPEKLLTGRKVLTIALLAFGSIVGVNIALVYFAIGSFPGLEVKNTYVASQIFDAEKTAQDALGWTVMADYQNTTLVLKFTDRDNQPVTVNGLIVSVGRATHANEDRQVFFDFIDGAYTASTVLGPGKWQVRLIAASQDGTSFRQNIPLSIGR